MPELNLHDTIALTITRLGGLGDGVGAYDGHAVFVPFTTVGDEIRAQVVSIRKGEIRARLIEVVEPGQGRCAAACSHFGVCGGCSLQHLSEEAYAAFKRENLAQMLRRLGCEQTTLLAMVDVGAGARRRVDLKVAVHKGVVQLGYFGMRSHALVDVAHCPVTLASITALFSPLRTLIASLKKPGNVKAVHLTRAESGCDVTLFTATRLPLADREKIKVFAEGHDILRVSESVTEGEAQSIITKGKVEARFGNVAVELPAPAFLQATQVGQAAITGFILQHVAGHGRVMDLYSGCGTYSFPLQQNGHRVVAYEGHPDLVAAMHNAIRRYGLEAQMNVSARDLFAAPIASVELKHTDAVVINPPRNGAETQAKELAKSDVRKIVMVSCNPVTFERDAKHLLQHGYRLTACLPIDQFHWSTHLELVAAFEK